MKDSAKIILFPNAKNTTEEDYIPQNAQDEAQEKVIESGSLGESDIESINLDEELESLLDETKANGRQNNAFRLDEMPDNQIEKYSENHQLVKNIERGLNPREAGEHVESKRSRRAIAYLYKRYEEGGKRALVDGRWHRKTKVTVLVPQVKNMIFKLYFSAPLAGARGIRRLLKKKIEPINNEIERINNEIQTGENVKRREKLLIPSASYIHKHLAGFPEAVKKARTSIGLKEYQKQGAPYMRYENTKNANERWQIDHTTLKIWIRVRRDGKWEACRVYLTLALDCHSRAIMGAWLSTKYGDTWAIKIMLYFAIRPKSVAGWHVFGQPQIIQCDNGGDFISDAMLVSLAALGITIDVDHPYYPNSKGKVERVFRTLDTMCFRQLSGHVADIGTSSGSANKRIAELLTRDQLKKELELSIVEFLHGTKRDNSCFVSILIFQIHSPLSSF